MSLLKRIESYASAIFTLGRIKNTAKSAQRLADAAQPRLDALEDRASAGDLRAQALFDEIAGQGGRLTERADHAHARLDVINRDLDAMQAALDARTSAIAGLEGRLDAVKADQNRHDGLAEDLVAAHDRALEVSRNVQRAETALLARMFSDLSRRLDAGAPPPAAAPTPSDLPHREGLAAFTDQFYHRLENRWRGATDEIARRLKIYIPDVAAAAARTGGKPVMDLGCGRGEWLGLLAGRDIPAFGVDTNTVQIEEARAAGLDARAGDALAALADQPDASLSAVTAHHLIEHLPFDAVAWITREAIRALAPGGLLIFETPNTRNLIVGATSFHTDPTHLKPMPAEIMEVLFETAGFAEVEARNLNPHARLGEFLDRPGFDPELAHLMFGPQDLAILGRAPEAD